MRCRKGAGLVWSCALFTYGIQFKGKIKKCGGGGVCAALALGESGDDGGEISRF